MTAPGWLASSSMKLQIAGCFLLGACASLLASCAAPQSSTVGAASQSSAVAPVQQSAASSAVNRPSAPARTVWVAPPTGSLLGGGYVRVADNENITGTDESALVARIQALDAAAGSDAERPFVARAVAIQTGISERDLVTQQLAMGLRYGELLAVNCIARQGGRPPAEIAAQKAKGKSWSELAASNRLSMASVVQSARNASVWAQQAYLARTNRKSGVQMMRDLGVHDVPKPGG
jgi:hypothetical protein